MLRLFYNHQEYYLENNVLKTCSSLDPYWSECDSKKKVSSKCKENYYLMENVENKFNDK